jgi:hypothetical protein
LPDSLEDDLDLFIVIFKSLFKFRELSRQFPVRLHHLSEHYKRPYNKNAGFDCPWCFEYACCHNCAVFGEGIRKERRKLEFREVIVICDHLRSFFGGKLKHEVFGKTFTVPLDLFVDSLGCDAVNLCKIGIQNNLLAPYKDFLPTGRIAPARSRVGTF